MKPIFVIILLILSSALMANAVSPSGTLPVIYINTENNLPITDKENYISAECRIDPAGSGQPALGNEDEPVTVNIRGRGNYTWSGFDKKPYKLKFDKKTSVLGLPKNKHYALLAHADDNLGFLRNSLGFILSRDLHLPWTPSDYPVELVLNGEYSGLYFLTETIRVDKERVNITEMEDNISDDVTGGWLVEIDNYDTDPHITLTEGNGERIIFTYKSPESLSPSQYEYLKSEMESLNAMIYGDKESDILWERLNIDTAARFFIIQEILDDCESYHGSCYLYKDKGESEKWHFGPVWDFGNAFRRGYKDKFIFENPSFNQTWIGELYKFPRFQEKVREIWKDYCSNECSGLLDKIKIVADLITSAAKKDTERWPQYGTDKISVKLREMVGYVSASLKWLGNEWGYEAPDISLPEQIYVRGSFNGWSTSHPMELDSNGNWILTGLSFPNMTELKIASEDWSTVDYGASQPGMWINPESEFSLSQKGANIYIPECKDMTLIFKPDVPSLLLTASGAMEDISANSIAEPDNEIYTPSGIRVHAITHPGIYIIRKGKESYKYVRR